MGKYKEVYDFVIIGGGLFGVYAALYIARKGKKVCIIEKEHHLMKKASIVNQARLHGGYHYPRSVATALMSDDNKQRFTEDHKAFTNFHFKKYYAIDQFGSLTDAAQFERFCAFIDIHCKRVKKHDLFSFNRLEALYETIEYSFDPILIAQYYREQLEQTPAIIVKKGHWVVEANAQDETWFLTLQNTAGAHTQIEANQVINATYSASNSINELFGVPPLKLMHEISEIALLNAPQLTNIGLTIMDGPFCSIMPYGLSGLLSLSSVAYTHHKVSYEDKPTFDCQAKNTACVPERTAICNACHAQPASNYPKMLSQVKQYLSPDVELNYYHSLYTIKSKLMANFIDDGRPTEISILNETPRFYAVFAGKINSIYEIEKKLVF